MGCLLFLVSVWPNMAVVCCLAKKALLRTSFSTGFDGSKKKQFWNTRSKSCQNASVDSYSLAWGFLVIVEMSMGYLMTLA